MKRYIGGQNNTLNGISARGFVQGFTGLSQSLRNKVKKSYLPGEHMTGMTCSVNTNLKWKYESGTTENPLSPSPFKVNNTSKAWVANDEFYLTRFGDVVATVDTDGLGNTRIISQAALVGNQYWGLNGNTLDNTSAETLSPAACVCARYNTTGTEALCTKNSRWKTSKVWYLPACGELVYIVPNYTKNNAAINKCIELFNVGVVVASSGYWPSTQVDSTHAWRVSTTDGNIYPYIKTNARYVRAFCAIPLSIH